MRRLLRILLNTATALSLLLLVTTIVLWVRSYCACDIVGWPGAEHNYHSVYTVRGGLFVVTDQSDWWGHDPPGIAYKVEPPATPEYVPEDQRFGFYRHHYGGGKVWVPEADVLRLPLYPAAAATAVLPIIGFVRLRRLRRARSREHALLCPACGYDLRATPDRCPECGTTAPLRSP